MCLPCTPFETWVQKVEELYERRSEVSLAHKLVVFTGCVCLSGEYSALEKGETADWYDTLSKRYQRATLKAIGELPLVVSPTWDNMESMLAAVRSAVCFEDRSSVDVEHRPPFALTCASLPYRGPSRRSQRG